VSNHGSFRRRLAAVEDAIGPDPMEIIDFIATWKAPIERLLPALYSRFGITRRDFDELIQMAKDELIRRGVELSASEMTV
jgi:hypothetical protein